jgi:hypothetical protein
MYKFENLFKNNLNGKNNWIYYIQQPIHELLGCPWTIRLSINCWIIHNVKTHVMKILINLIMVSKLTNVFTLDLHWCAFSRSFKHTFSNQNLKYALKNCTPIIQEQVQDVMLNHKLTRLQNLNRMCAKIIKQYVCAKFMSFKV